MSQKTPSQAQPAKKRAAKQDKLSMLALQETQHSLEASFQRLASHPDGLTHAEAADRLQKNGPNEVAHDKPPFVLVQLLLAFKNPFIFVLLILAIISVVTDYWLPLQEGEETDLTGALIIFTMVILSGLLRFWQEYRSSKTAQALKSMVKTTATVRRRRDSRSPSKLVEVGMKDRKSVV